MNTITLLMNEHRFIERLLDALDAYSLSVAGGVDLERSELASLARFFVEYADRHHHGKEEKILFAVMARHGFSTEAGPLAVMLSEHVQGRALVAALAAIAARPGPWKTSERSEVADTAQSFSQLLRHHIMKEDRILYPMAQTHLPAETMEEVNQATSAFEARSHDGGRREELVALGLRLMQRYSPRDEAAAAPA